MRQTSKLAYVALLAFTVSALTGPMQASAQDRSNQPRAEASKTAASAYKFSAARMIGIPVENGQGDTVGEISDLIVSPKGGISHVVVEVGGYLGVGAREVLIPYADLQKTGENRILLEAAKDNLKRRPEIVYPEDDGFVLTSLQTRAHGDDTKAEYERAMEERISAWSEKMDEYATKAKREAKQAASATEESLDRAWSNVEEQWRELQKGSDETWNEAQQSLDSAWEKFEQAWSEATGDKT